jgi:hypothetical protein
VLIVFFSAAVAAVCESRAHSLTVCADAIHSRVPASVMQSAVQVSRSLFQETGVQVYWKITQAGRRTKVQPEDPCDRANLRVVIVASRFSPRGGNTSVLGEASLHGNVVAYYHRIEDYARRTRMPSDVVFGYVLAHELGHVILGTNSHAEEGVMRAEWRPHELTAMLDGHLRFDKPEISGMQARLRTAVLARAQR